MSALMNRQPAGTPAGGQFATGARHESDVALAEPTRDRAITQYLETAIWSSIGDDGEALELDVDDLAPEAVAQAEHEVREFFEANAELLEKAREVRPDYSDGDAAHDFWLTRNGHGAGFWDRGLGEAGDELTEVAKAWGSQDLYVGDDGKGHLS